MWAIRWAVASWCSRSVSVSTSCLRSVYDVTRCSQPIRSPSSPKIGTKLTSPQKPVPSGRRKQDSKFSSAETGGDHVGECGAEVPLPLLVEVLGHVGALELGEIAPEEPCHVVVGPEGDG